MIPNQKKKEEEAITNAFLYLFFYRKTRKQQIRNETFLKNFKY